MINTEEYAKRRESLLELMQPNSVAIVAAARELTRSRDTEYPFRQDSNFFYLTGFREPEAWLLLSNRDDKFSSMIICQEKDRLAEIWHGRRMGPEQVKSDCAVDYASDLSTLEDTLTNYIDGHDQLYTLADNYDDVEDRIKKVLATLRSAPKKGLKAPHTQIDVAKLLHEMRLFKSDTEVEVMQKAGDITAKAHCRAMQYTKPGAWEFQVEAEIQHEFAMHGARFVAYNSIVGGGDNACILHYTDNQDLLQDGDLLLIDAGCEFHGYAADITRTFPVNGCFSEPQAQLYQIVLDAQMAAIEAIKPGNTLAKATKIASEVIVQGLIQLGILSGTVSENIKTNKHKDYFLHGLGHWLGLDVHDVGDYKIDGKEREFEPGMVLTVEPGIYIDQNAKVDDKWKGIGIRIEDNILVTELGHYNLTSKVPKQIKDIEMLMADNK